MVNLFESIRFISFLNIHFNPFFLFFNKFYFKKASAHQKNLDIGANLFIGNLDPEVDEKLLYDTFSAFGVILQVPKVSLELNNDDV